MPERGVAEQGEHLADEVQRGLRYDTPPLHYDPLRLDQRLRAHLAAGINWRYSRLATTIKKTLLQAGLALTTQRSRPTWRRGPIVTIMATDLVDPRHTSELAAAGVTEALLEVPTR